MPWKVAEAISLVSCFVWSDSLKCQESRLMAWRETRWDSILNKGATGVGGSVVVDEKNVERLGERWCELTARGR